MSNSRRLLALPLIVLAFAAGIMNPAAPALADGEPHITWFVGLASGELPKESACDDNHFVDPFTNGAKVIAHEDGLVVVAAQFWNLCDSPIAPLKVRATLSSGNTSTQLIVNAMPSVVEPGSIGFYMATVPEELIPNPNDIDFDVNGEDWNFDQMIEVARLLTVDANGNDANSPDFDPASIVQFGETNRWAVTAYPDGPPPAFPPNLILHGRCADGNTGFGLFTPDSYGYNPVGPTTFEGNTIWLNCHPEHLASVTGPWIDAAWVDARAHGLGNSILLDDLTLDQQSDTTFRLTGNLFNTNSIVGRPATYNFSLNRVDDGSPFVFAVPGKEEWFPGTTGHFSINNIPGEADDYNSVVASATGTVGVPGAVFPVFTLPPTAVFADGTLVASYDFVVPDYAALEAANGPGGTLTIRTWFQQPDNVYLIGSEAFAVDAAEGAIPVETKLSALAAYIFQQAQEMDAYYQQQGYLDNYASYSPPK